MKSTVTRRYEYLKRHQLSYAGDRIMGYLTDDNIESIAVALMSMRNMVRTACLLEDRTPYIEIQLGPKGEWVQDFIDGLPLR